MSRGEAMIKGFLWLIWNGTVEMSKKDSRILTMYIILLGMMIASGLFLNDISAMLILTTPIAVALGVVHFLKDVLPYKKKREFFNRVFEEINLKADGGVPYFLSTDEVSRFITSYSFKTYLPLKMWLAKLDHLEMHMNEKIIDIKQSSSSKNVVSVYVESEPLPRRIDWDGEYSNKSNVLNIGWGYYGIIGMNLEKTPHAFVAGETGSGKSNILKCWIEQALYHGHEVVLIDFKRGVSFSGFSSEVAVYYDYKSIIAVLKDMVSETIERLDTFRDYGVDNFIDYNKIADDYLPRKIIFIDELAELLKTRDKEISTVLYDSIETLTRLCMAVGIHLIMGIQRPDSTIISGQIKNNVSYRVCGRFVDKEPSRIMLGTDIANTLPNIRGRFIIKDDDLYEVQSFFFYKEKSAPQKRRDNPEKSEEFEPILIEEIEENERAEINDTMPKEQIKEAEQFDFSEFKK